jgi:hypothetical protein
MGKKNKKRSQQKKQTKSLKRRSKQKEQRKLRPPKRTSGYPGMPGGMPANIPPDMQAKLNKMAQFSAPLITLGDPDDMEVMQQMAPFVQGFWEAFSEKDMEKREAILTPLKEAYAQMAWGKVDFEELAEFFLKRHIYFMPDAHSEEERSRYSDDELKAAAEQESLLPETDVKEFKVREVSTIPEIDPEAAKSLLSETEQTELSELHDFLKSNYKDIDFIDVTNPALQKTLDFQNRLLDLFKSSLEHIQLVEEEIAAHLNNLQSFFDPFLKEFHQASLLDCHEDQVEEYLLDYYIRKVDHTPLSEELLIDSFRAFFTFAEKTGYLEDARPFLERIAESKEEYAELWKKEEEE